MVVGYLLMVVGAGLAGERLQTLNEAEWEVSKTVPVGLRSVGPKFSWRAGLRPCRRPVKPAIQPIAWLYGTWLPRLHPLFLNPVNAGLWSWTGSNPIGWAAFPSFSAGGGVVNFWTPRSFCTRRV